MILNNIVFNTVSIEVTRRCNMRCPHCLRGESQNKDIDLNYIDIFMKRLNSIYIRRLFFTGGEPTLNLEAIKYAISCTTKYNIVVESFELISNGKNISDECISFFNSIDNFKVAISIDDYHDSLSDSDLSQLKKIKNIVTKGADANGLLNIGRAKTNNIGVEDLNTKHTSLIFSCYKTNLLVISVITLTLNGNILRTCDFDYDYEFRYKICKYDENLIKILFNSHNIENTYTLQDLNSGHLMYAFFDWLKKQNLPL